MSFLVHWLLGHDRLWFGIWNWAARLRPDRQGEGGAVKAAPLRRRVLGRFAPSTAKIDTEQGCLPHVAHGNGHMNPRNPACLLQYGQCPRDSFHTLYPEEFRQFLARRRDYRAPSGFAQVQQRHPNDGSGSAIPGDLGECPLLLSFQEVTPIEFTKFGSSSMRDMRGYQINSSF